MSQAGPPGQAAPPPHALPNTDLPGHNAQPAQPQPGAAAAAAPPMHMGAIAAAWSNEVPVISVNGEQLDFTMPVSDLEGLPAHEIVARAKQQHGRNVAALVAFIKAIGYMSDRAAQHFNAFHHKTNADKHQLMTVNHDYARQTDRRPPS